MQMARMMVVSAAIAVSIPSVATADNPCVEVEIGGDKALALACVNDHFQKQVDDVRFIENLPPVHASSPASTFGGFSLSALRQQYGSNLGKSAVPYRPSRVYGANLGRTAP